MVKFEITTDADQKFSCILNNKRVSFRVRYNPTTDRWSFDLSIDDLPVLYGRRIVTGVDLVDNFNFDIGHIFAYPTVAGEFPDRDGLPSGLVSLFYISDEELTTVLAA